jgi:uncharacterized protein (TIGR02246 family)
MPRSQLPEPHQDIAAVALKWAEAVGQNDPDRVVALYAGDAVLWGTLSPVLRSDRTAIRDYFVGLFANLPAVTVTLGEHLIRRYGAIAINTGYYTFSYFAGGEARTLPARFSFTLMLDDENWMIVDHHSSAIPPPLH